MAAEAAKAKSLAAQEAQAQAQAAAQVGICLGLFAGLWEDWESWCLFRARVYLGQCVRCGAVGISILLLMFRSITCLCLKPLGCSRCNWM